MTSISNMLTDLEHHIKATEAENVELRGLLYELGKQAEAILSAIARFGDQHEAPEPEASGRLGACPCRAAARETVQHRGALAPAL